MNSKDNGLKMTKFLIGNLGWRCGLRVLSVKVSHSVTWPR